MAIWDRWQQWRNKRRQAKAQVVAQEPIDLFDRRLVEILGIELDEINLRGKNALKEATVYACVRIIADAVGKLPVKIYQDSDGKRQATDHYLSPLLKLRPNPWMTARDMFRALESQRLVHGNAYGWLEVPKRGKNTGRIQGIYPLDSTRVEIVVDDIGLLADGQITMGPTKGKIWYVYTDNKGKQYKLRPDEVLHFKGLSFDGIVGLSPLERLRGTIENAGYARSFLNKSFKQGLQAAGIVHYVGDLSPEAQKRFREKFEEMSAGLKNANRVALLPIGYQYQPLEMKLADAQFLENMELTIRQIAAAFGVKMHQLNELSRATHTNIEEQQREFYVDTLMDILTGYEQELTYKLFTQQELEAGYYVKFNANAILRADPKTRYEGYRIAIQSGFMTPNEVRELEEMEPLEGGDRLLVNGNMMPVELAGVQYAKKGGESGGEEA